MRSNLRSLWSIFGFTMVNVWVHGHTCKSKSYRTINLKLGRNTCLWSGKMPIQDCPDGRIIPHFVVLYFFVVIRWSADKMGHSWGVLLYCDLGVSNIISVLHSVHVASDWQNGIYVSLCTLNTTKILFNRSSLRSRLVLWSRMFTISTWINNALGYLVAHSVKSILGGENNVELKNLWSHSVLQPLILG